MSGPSHLDPHTVACAAWSISYWAGNTASGAEGADCAELAMVGGYPRFGFALPAERRELQQLAHALSTAFDAGKAARSGEIARLIGPPR